MASKIDRLEDSLGSRSIQHSSELLLSQIREREPSLDELQARELANVWLGLLDSVLTRMFAIGEAEAGPLHIDQKADATFEIAKLTLWLGKTILDRKAQEKPLGSYRADAERALLRTANEAAKIENTARTVADKIWIPFILNYRKKRPLILSATTPERPARLIKPRQISITKQMHYVPQSTTRQWIDRRTGKFHSYSRRPDGTLKRRLLTPKSWGVATSIYTIQREAWFGLVEGDARRPYDKLAAGIPLNDGDVRHWVAFLIVQIMRTPRLMKRMAEGLKKWLQQTQFIYPSTSAALGRAYDSIFENNKLYARYHRLLTGRRWTVLKAAPGKCFLKGDNPVVILGRAPRTWRLLYPLTPERCLLVGPERDNKPDKIIFGRSVITKGENDVVNVAICEHAELSVIGFPDGNSAELEQLIQKHLGKASRPSDVELPFWDFDLRLNIPSP